MIIQLAPSIEGPDANESMVNVPVAADSIRGMSIAAARIKAELEELVTPESERWLRTFHPSLERYESVHVQYTRMWTARRSGWSLSARNRSYLSNGGTSMNSACV